MHGTLGDHDFFDLFYACGCIYKWSLGDGVNSYSSRKLCFVHCSVQGMLRNSVSSSY